MKKVPIASIIKATAWHKSLNVCERLMQPNDQKLRRSRPATQQTNDSLAKPQCESAVASSAVLARMVELAEKWRKRSCYKFKSAELEPDEMGKKLIQHGAICYYNCWSELQEIVAALRALTTPSKPEMSKKPQA